MPAGRILEVGCHEGDFLDVLKSRGWYVKGLEIQAKSKEYIIEHDASLPFPIKEKFDVVLAVEVIEHIVDTEAFLVNCKDALNKNGLFIVTTPNLLFWVNRIRMFFGLYPLFAYADHHVRMFIWKDLKEKINKHFEIHKFFGTHVFMGIRHTRAFIVFSLLADIFPRLSAHFIVVAKKKSIDR